MEDKVVHRMFNLSEAFKCNTSNSQTCFRSRKQNLRVCNIKNCSKLSEKGKDRTGQDRTGQDRTG